MSRGAAVPLAIVIGGLVGMQAPINARLGKTVGTFPAAAVSFLVGTIALVLLASFIGGWGKLGEIRSVPVTYLVGGLIGAAFVSSSLVTVQVLGAGGVTAATISGQLAISVAVDHFGLIGVERQPASALRLLGVAFLAIGTFLIVRE